MTKYLSSHRFITVLIIFFIISGALLGAIFGQNNIAPKSATYGMAAFALFPVVFCLFGLKEYNNVYGKVVSLLTNTETRRFKIFLEKKYNQTIVLATIVILIQIFLSFYLLYVSKENSALILGSLFGNIFASLSYGLFVCYSVRGIFNFYENILLKRKNKKDLEDFKASFK